MFPTGYTVYDERVNQGMKKPCLFVLQPKMLENKQLRERYERKYNIVITYHPQEEVTSSYGEFNDIGDKLAKMVRLLKLGERSIRGYDISYETKNDVVHVYVSYNLILTHEEVKVLMQKLKVTIITK